MMAHFRKHGDANILTAFRWLLVANVLLSAALVSGVSVVRDVNNMLRDDGAAATTEQLKTTEPKLSNEVYYDDDNNNNNENMDISSYDDDGDGDLELHLLSRLELLRFVDENVRGATTDSTASIASKATTDSAATPATATSTTTTTTARPKTSAAAAASTATTFDFNAASDAVAGDATLSLNDQVRLLSKQLNALLTRRREDYESLEHNLRKSLRITTDAATVDLDIRNELEQLRHEVKTLRDGHLSANKERLTVEWLQQSVAELRKQLVELQQVASSASKDVRARSQTYEDAATMRSDFQQLKLELAALKERQQQTEVYVQELREEALQQEEDYKRLLHNTNNNNNRQHDVAIKHDEVEEMKSDVDDDDKIIKDESDTQNLELSTETLADHKRRHCRFQRQQLHELQLAQRQLKRQFNELKYHRIGERVRSIEIEQHRIADANFNLSRQIASLDKLHASMLELLEDVEGLQSKMDKGLPELRHEISKLEFSNAQLNSEQSLVREEGKNVARSLQAMAVSVSTLQDERDGVRQTQSAVAQLQTSVDRMQSQLQDVQRALMHHRHRGEKKLHHAGKTTKQHQHNNKNNSDHDSNNDNNNSYDDNAAYAPMTQHAESLVAKLENVEQQYESIIDKLPQDCSEVSATPNTATDGLYLIAPTGQHRPLMAHCNADGWTTVQRRYDGSADFNRSWEDYANGFGAPAGEYWIGNEQLHHLTLDNCTALRVHMQDIYDNVWVAEYEHFYVSSRADGYRLQISGYAGNASDALDYQQGMQFSAIDVDRDISQTHCAANYEGGWWFSHCQHANLNGRYNLGLTWFDAARNEWIAVKSSQMMIKRQASCVAVAAMALREAASASAAAAATPATTTLAPTTIVSSKWAAHATDDVQAQATTLSSVNVASGV